MRNLRASALLVPLLILLLAACGGSGNNTGSPDSDASSRGQTTSAPRTGLSQSEDPSTTIQGEVREAPAGVSRGTPPGLQSRADAPQSAKGASAAPEPEYNNDAANDYWATDGCHYYYSSGVWYGDICVVAAAPGLINIFRYVGGGQRESAPFVQISVDPNRVVMRDLTDPLFNYILWMSWPKGQQPSAVNTTYQLPGRSDWLTGEQVYAIWRQMASGAPQQPPQEQLDPQWREWAAIFNGNLANDLARPWTQPNCVGLDYRDDPRCP